jgi:hypothetical protein
MNITADSVRGMGVGARLVAREIKQISRTIESQIREAAKDGHEKTVVLIPTQFKVSSEDHSATQAIIYDALIRELEKNGFRVRINMESPLTFEISWASEIVQDVSQMVSNIAAHSVQAEKTK